MRRAAKRDTAERPIIEALVAVGIQVEQLEYPCDLATRHRGVLRFLEVKTGNRKADARQKAQTEFLEEWAVPIVRTPEQALAAHGIYAEPAIRLAP